MRKLITVLIVALAIAVPLIGHPLDNFRDFVVDWINQYPDSISAPLNVVRAEIDDSVLSLWEASLRESVEVVGVEVWGDSIVAATLRWQSDASETVWASAPAWVDSALRVWVDSSATLPARWRGDISDSGDVFRGDIRDTLESADINLSSHSITWAQGSIIPKTSVLKVMGNTSLALTTNGELILGDDENDSTDYIKCVAYLNMKGNKIIALDTLIWDEGDTLVQIGDTLIWSNKFKASAYVLGADVITDFGKVLEPFDSTGTYTALSAWLDGDYLGLTASAHDVDTTAANGGGAKIRAYVKNHYYELTDTAFFAWKIPCDSVNACVAWDTLGAYADTNVTNSIWDSLAAYPDTTVTNAILDSLADYVTKTYTFDSLKVGAGGSYIHAYWAIDTTWPATTPRIAFSAPGITATTPVEVWGFDGATWQVGAGTVIVGACDSLYSKTDSIVVVVADTTAASGAAGHAIYLRATR